MKEVFGNITLYNDDCMEIMRAMPDNAFDLAIVDPPYRDMIDNSPTKDMRNNGTMKNFGNKPTKEYFEELYRVSKNQIIWGANNFQLPPFPGFIIWRKTNVPAENFTMSAAEIASISMSLGTTSKVFEYTSSDKNRLHPTQKPVALYKWLLSKYANSADRILDTHLGSGSSAIAAHDGGFEFTGIEIDPRYYAAARQRLINHQMQQKLF